MNIKPKEIFNRNCPCCHSPIGISDRIVVLIRESISCKYCTKHLRPNFKIALFNVFWLNASIALLIKQYTSLEFIWVVIASVLFTNAMVPALDLLFSLEEDNNSMS